MLDSKFELLRRSALPEEIAARLLDLIREQELRPGDKLPPERELAAMIGVSRPILREALRALSIMKVVDIRQGSGTYITSLEPKQLISHLEFVFSKDNVGFLELFEARRVLEVGYIRLAAARISTAQLDHLGQLLAELGRGLDDADRFSNLDIEFHNTICAAANNSLLTQFMQSTISLGKASRERTGRGRAVRERTLHDHRAILEALQARDPRAAEAAMAEHLDHVEEALKGTLRPVEPQPEKAV
jgi:GntR family transcriptional regulator, transcriptional repressor for pyruvate dehydrogenase complex